MRFFCSLKYTFTRNSNTIQKVGNFRYLSLKFAVAAIICNVLRKKIAQSIKFCCIPYQSSLGGHCPLDLRLTTYDFKISAIRQSLAESADPELKPQNRDRLVLLRGGWD